MTKISDTKFVGCSFKAQLVSLERIQRDKPDCFPLYGMAVYLPQHEGFMWWLCTVYMQCHDVRLYDKQYGRRAITGMKPLVETNVLMHTKPLYSQFAFSPVC